jgi:putative oxidoreductase
MRKLLFLNSAQRFSDFTLLLMRLFVGLFLILNIWDNIVDAARMQEYVSLLAKHGFMSPKILAPVSVYLQLLIGLGFVLGLFTRWAGIICVIHFAIAIALIERFTGMRGTFPSGCLVVIGLYLATHGAGRFSVDEVLKANQQPRANGGVRFRN